MSLREEGWGGIDDQDIPDFKCTQPEMFKRHWPEKKETGRVVSKQVKENQPDKERQ